VISTATAVLVLAFIVSGCGAQRSTVSTRPGRYYLALGDSIAYGHQPTMKPTAPASADTGYVYPFAARLRSRFPHLRVVDYGCPGESTVTFIRGSCPGAAAGYKAHNAFRGAQLRAADTFLRVHAGEVSLITLTLWGNDWVSLLVDRCKGNVACVRVFGPRTIAAIGARLTSILKRLRASAPGAEILVTGAWNPDPGSLRQLAPVYGSLNVAIGRAASAANARVVNAERVFNPPGPVRKQQARLCKFTFICSRGDPHPTDAGYRALAAAFMAASGYGQK
jgi:lysophospholipase L1-like esterase